MLRYRDCATPLNWIMMAWSSWATSTTKQNRIYQFFQKKFNPRRLQFLFTYSFSNWLAVSCFAFWKTFVKCPSLSVNGIFDDVTSWRHLHVTMLKCGAKFSNELLVRWSISEITKLCLNLSKLCLKYSGLFFRTRCTWMFIRDVQKIKSDQSRIKV